MNEVAVEFRNVDKSYGSVNVLKNFNLTVPKGEIVTIIGPSGCGKTTILKMINRLIEPDEGNIILEKQDIGKLDPVQLRRKIGYVIQQIGLFPHMTIEENISVVPRLRGVPKKRYIKRTEALLELIGLDPKQFRKRYPYELSGGQQQRVGVARALASDPSIILMDEPFSALDPISRIQLQKELIKLNQQLKKTIIFVTHDIDEALKIADQVILIKDGEVVQKAPPSDLLKNPRNEFVRNFIGPERFQLAPEATIANTVMVSTHSVFDDSAVLSAFQLMQKNHIEGLAVVDHNQKCLGVIDIDEINKLSAENGDLKAGEILRADGPRISKKTRVSEIFDLLTIHSIIPVVDDEGKLEGTVTRSSVLEALKENFTKKEVIG